MSSLTRRAVVSAAVAGAFVAPFASRARGDSPAASFPADPGLPPGFPRLDPTLVNEVVGASHGNEAKVRQLIEAHPSLVNGWWDWGFGDWESPLGAAAHVGNRPIAEFLIQSGARVDLFAAAMLGWTDVVRAFIAASPGVQRTAGPHGISLLAHARAGGERASETFRYLDSLGDAGASPALQPLSDEDKQRYLGAFEFAGAAPRGFEIKLSARKVLQFTMPDVATCVLHHLGNHEFFPAGVPTSRFQFTLDGSRAVRIDIVTQAWRLSAVRVNG